MNVHFQPLSHKFADKFHWIPPTDAAHVAGLPLLPLHAGELAAAATTMPLAFAQLDGVWNLVGVTGLQPQHNLFVRDGKWLGRYQPACVSTYDFDLQVVGNMALLRFNTAGKLSANPGAQGAVSMFDEQGKHSTAVQAIQDQLVRTTPLFLATQKAIQALADAQVLAPWPQKLKDDTQMKLSDLYFVDEAALAALSDSAFLQLRQAKALGIAYAVNLSLYQSHLLVRLNKHNPAVDTPADVDTLFGEGMDDDTLRFDF